MADIVDLGNEQAEYLLELALAQRAAAQPRGPSATHCEDCDEPIPALRREKVAGCTTCVECQRVREVKRG